MFFQIKIKAFHHRGPVADLAFNLLENEANVLKCIKLTTLDIFTEDNLKHFFQKMCSKNFKVSFTLSIERERKKFGAQELLHAEINVKPVL